MCFEWDPKKSKKNEAQHELSFEDAKQLWLSNTTRIGPKSVSLNNDQIEKRYLVIGKINDKHWTAVITYRQENIRIISCRRSRKNEVKIYEKEK